MSKPSAEVAVPFPDELPPGYAWFDDEPAFDPHRQFQLDVPDRVVTLADLGDTAISGTSTTNPAVSTPPSTSGTTTPSRSTS
ncbi:MAG: hypothetical protein AB8G26_11120 [Ilumatobacter sp.]